MINFILCDDNKEITEIIKNIITRIVFSKLIEYKIYVFNEYNSEFHKLVNSNIENKVYILDIEVKNKSGIEISKKIREKDWNSIILLLTAHYELENLAYHSKILLLEFISKFDLYEEKINDVLLMCINKIISNDKLSFNINKTIYNIEYKYILYLYYDKSKRKTIIVTDEKNYETTKTLKYFKSKLKGIFLYSHKSCIVNMSNVKSVDFKNKIIIFKNNKTVDLLSKKYYEEVKKCFI